MKLHIGYEKYLSVVLIKTWLFSLLFIPCYCHLWLTQVLDTTITVYVRLMYMALSVVVFGNYWIASLWGWVISWTEWWRCMSMHCLSFKIFHFPNDISRCALSFLLGLPNSGVTRTFFILMSVCTTAPNTPGHFG